MSDIKPTKVDLRVPGPQHIYTVEQAKKFALEVVANWDQIDLCRFLAECHPDEKVQVGNAVCTYDYRTSDFIWPRRREVNSVTSKATSTRFEKLFDTAITGLREYHPELRNEETVNQIKGRIYRIDTGNDQYDYETIRNQIELVLRRFDNG